MPEISFHYLEVDYTLSDDQKIVSWLHDVCNNEHKDVFSLDYILVTDDYLLTLNKKYLDHHTLTDILTFNLGENDRIEGEIYISVDRVIENAQKFQIESQTEMLRVLVHGLLHLLGYNDQSVMEKKEMRRLEDHYLSQYTKQ